MTEPNADRELWIRQFHPRQGDGIRLVCLPHAGGAASFFHGLSAALAPDVGVLAVQFPGRQDRRLEPPVGDIPTLADHIVEVLRPWPTEQLAFFGHSMGALVGFEVIRRLEAGGTSPAAFFPSARWAPHFPTGVEKIHELDDDGILAEIRKLNGTHGGLFEDQELLRMMLPTIRNDYRAAESYTFAPGSPLNVPITAFIGDSDPRLPVERMREWEEHTVGGFDIHVFPGGHFYPIGQSTEVAAEISRRLTRRAARS